VQSSVEVYESVYYEDDGMRTYDVTKAPLGWHIIAGDYGSDGELGTIICSNSVGVGTFNGYVDKSISFLVSNYRYVIVRCSSLPADTFKVEARYDGTTRVQATITTAGLATLDMSGWGDDSIDAIRLYALSSLENTVATFDYIVVTNTIMSNIFPTGLEVNRRVTEGFDDARITYDYEYTFPLLGSHMKIWISKDTISNYIKEFAGKTKLNREILDGKVPKWHETECDGYGKYLYERKYTGEIIDEVDNVINTITTVMRDEGLITTYNVTTSSTEVKVRGEKGGRLIGDIMEDDICRPEKQLDWDFYVDFGKDLHSYKKGTRTQDINVGTHAISFNYEKDCEKIIDSFDVYGALGKNIGNDASYTENSTSWYAPEAIATVSDELQVGTIAVRGKGNDHDMILEYTFPTAIDISGGGYMYAYLRYIVYNSMKEGPLDYTIIYKTDDSNYFSSSFKKGGGQGTWYAQIFAGTGDYWLHDWFDIKKPLTKYYSPTDFTKVGNPDWSSITKVKIQINSPLPDTGKYAYLWVDGLSIDTKYSGSYKDATAIGSFGVQSAPDEIIPTLESDAECTVAASLVVEAYKDPIENITDLITTKSFDATIGRFVGFDVGDIDTSVDLRRITHSLEDFELTTELELSSRFVPSIDKMMAIFQRQMEYFDHDLEGWRDAFQGEALDRGREELVDWYNMETEEMPLHFWTEKEFRPLPFEYLSNYTLEQDEADQAHIDPEPPGGVKFYNSAGAAGGYAKIKGKTLIDNSIGSAFRVRFMIPESINASGILRIGHDLTDDGFGFTFVDRDNYASGTIYAQYTSAGSGTSNWEHTVGDWTVDTWYDLKAYWLREDSVAHFYLNNIERQTLSVSLPLTLNVFIAGFESAGKPPNSTMKIRDFQIAGD